MALLPHYLQNLGGYSITSTGLLMAPRGLGTMLAMVLAGRLTSRVDPRLLMFAGMLMICASMWSMLGWTPDVDAWSLALTTFTQGVGLGFVFIPLQVLAFATLPANLRGDGTALFSLIRNVGRGERARHLHFVVLVSADHPDHARAHRRSSNPFNRRLQNGGAYLFWNSATAPGRAALNAEVTRQASIIAYLNDFKFMFVVCLATACLLLLLRRPPASSADTVKHAPIE